MIVTLPKPSRGAAKLYTRARPLVITATKEAATVEGLRHPNDPRPMVRDRLELAKGETVKLALERLGSSFVWVLL